MDDLRARLDAPLFHRDQGLGAPAQLPRLREISFDHAPLALEPVAEVEVAEVAAPVVAAPVVAEPVIAAPVVAEPVVAEPVEPAVPVRPKLVSFSELMSASALVQAPATEPLPQPLPQRQPAQPVVSEVVSEEAVPELGPTETQALLAVLAAFETSANRLHELNSPAVDVPAVADVVAPPPVRISQETPLVTASVADLHIAPAQGRSAVEAELNRLAFLPDQEEHVGPVVVPTIARTDQHPMMSVPILSQHEMYNPRATATVVAKKRSAIESAMEATNPPRSRRKKGLVRRILSMIVLLGLVGGGLFAAKYYLLDIKWDPDGKVLVDQVEATRNLAFDHAVEVTELSGDEYALRIANYSLGINSSNEDEVAGELRALGLVSGVLDLRLVGLAALPETPAFYDVGSEKIYVVSGLPAETYRFAMYRALTTALLDQKFGWGDRVKGASPTAVRGTRALFEADALATASSIATPTDRALVREQLGGLAEIYRMLPTPSPFGSAIAGRLGVSLRAFVESIPLPERGPIFEHATITDYQALDLRRLVSGTADGDVATINVLRDEASAVGSQSQGMLFWYHALAGRIDVASAWNAALAIQSDDVVVTQGATGYCVEALLTVAPAALDNVTAAFASWAALAPVESATSVVPSVVDGSARLAVNACDPGVAVANGQLPRLATGGAPLRSEQYRLLIIAQPTLTNAQAACAVYGGDNVSLDDARPLVDTAEGWLAPAAHPAPDPNRADCVGR